jgi:hypothetical protein
MAMSSSPPKIEIRVFVTQPGRLGVAFPYDAMWVKLVRGCEGSRWNSVDKHWEVPVKFLDEICGIFNLNKCELGPEVRREQRSAIIKKVTESIGIEVGPVTAKFTSKDYPRDTVDRHVSFQVPGHEFTPLFKRGHWDGWKSLLDKRSGTFPSGLVPRVTRKEPTVPLARLMCISTTLR